MTLINRTALYSNSSWMLDIPPFELQTSVEEIWDSTFVQIPFGSLVCPYTRRTGWDISVNGLYFKDAVAGGLTFQDNLRAALVDDNHEARDVSICLWYDSTESIQRIYRSCRLSSPIRFGDARTERVRSFLFNLRSLDPDVYATAADGLKPGTNDYEAYLYNGTGETGEMSFSVQRYMRDITMAGEAEVTDADNEGRMQKRITIGGDSTNMKISGIRVIGCESCDPNNSESQTRVVVSDAEWDGGGSSIKATVAKAATTGSLVTGSIVLSSGSNAYIFFDQAAGHVGVQVEITVITN